MKPFLIDFTFWWFVADEGEVIYHLFGANESEVISPILGCSGGVELFGDLEVELGT